ncbi:MAG: hypothetical protein JWM81_292 [Candidatus Saccharibacteria bacterium]|nr:hypothetical protein [Candidatus Saccharibacteria bacterium]
MADSEPTLTAKEINEAAAAGAAEPQPTVMTHRLIMTPDKPGTPVDELSQPEVVRKASTKKMTIEPLTEKPAEQPAATPQEVTEDTDSAEAAESESSDKADLEATDEDQAKTDHDNMVAELIEKGSYFLPINSVEQRRAKRAIILGTILILVLGAAWLDVALDANLIQINGWKAPTSFFSN